MEEREALKRLRRGDETALAWFILAFGVFQDGEFTGAETVSAQQHSYTFSIQENGVYCFSIEHFSSDANSFENGRVTIS